jgi:hypothetical protein
MSEWSLESGTDPVVLDACDVLRPLVEVTHILRG